MVRVPVAGDRMATLTATEILAGAREAPRQEAPRFVEPNGSAPGGSVCGIAVEGAGVRSSKSVPPGRTVARQTGGVPSFRERLEARLQTLPDVQRSASAFGDEDAYWVNGKEVLHFDAPDVVDVRLTRRRSGYVDRSCEKTRGYSCVAVVAPTGSRCGSRLPPTSTSWFNSPKSPRPRTALATAAPQSRLRLVPILNVVAGSTDPMPNRGRLQTRATAPALQITGGSAVR